MGGWRLHAAASPDARAADQLESWHHAQEHAIAIARNILGRAVPYAAVPWSWTDQYDINLQLAKITTLGERVEDTFLIDGPALQQNKMQLQIETEMLDAIV